MSETNNCPCCPNHCPVNNLSCGRGREYFKTSGTKAENTHSHHIEKDESSMTLEEKLIAKICKCGHYLHHRENGANLEFLSDEEKQSLIKVLSKCLDNWQ